MSCCYLGGIEVFLNTYAAVSMMEKSVMTRSTKRASCWGASGAFWSSGVRFC